MNGSRPGPAPEPAPGAGRGGAPAHLRPGLIGLVALGGALGSAARYGVELLVPDPAATGGWPLATLTVNLLGAFALGFGLEALARLGRETPRRRNARLAGGTGFLGGFTTYSALALETHGLLAGGELGVAAGYTLVTLLAGAVCCGAGVILGDRAGGAYLRRTRTASPRTGTGPTTGTGPGTGAPHTTGTTGTTGTGRGPETATGTEPGAGASTGGDG